MKKFTILITTFLFCATALFAQAPQKFSFQAVVRNASNQLIANSPVGVRVSILQGGINGTIIYMETHTVVTNENGLMTFTVGGGNLQQGDFASIDWANGFYYLKTELDPTGGTNYSIISAQQLLSVPYALYANESGNGFSGDYNDLSNTPSIPTVPTNVSDFTNDAGYLTGYTETDPQFNAWDKDYDDLINKPIIPTVPTNVSAFVNDANYLTGYTETDPQFNAWDKDYNDLTNKPVLFSGNYNDLTNKPTIPTVPTNVSAFTNDAGYITGYAETDPQFNAWNKDYNDLINKPTIPTVPTNVSAFTNDAGYITGYTETDPQFNAWDKNYNDLTNKPVLFSGDYNDLTNKPTIPTVPTNVSSFTNDAGYLTSYTEQQVLSISHDTLFLTGGSFVKLPAGFDGDYNSLTNKPALFSGSYNDLTNTPAIPTVPSNVSAFTNDAGYLTGYTETDPQFNAWNKDYNDLINKPTIPTIPTNVSSFTNDAGYITGYTETDPQFNAWDKNYNDLTNKPVLFSGDYNDLTNKPTIPTVPTNVSSFTNDAGYLTSYIEQQVLSISHDTLFLTGGSCVKLPAGFDGDYNSLANKPELFDGNYNSLTNTPIIPTVPTNVSAFHNDAGYITLDAVPTVPTNVSAFSNDAGYITMDSVPAIPTNVSAFVNDIGYLTAANVQEAANIPTNVSAFNNDAGYITMDAVPTLPTNVSAFNNDAGYITMDSVPAIPTNVSAFVNDANYLTDYAETDPQFNAWDKDYNSLTNKPELFDGDYNSLTNTPELFDGNYNSLTNKPELFDGDYNSLTNTPEIPTVPTNVSAFNNDAGYITMDAVPTVPTNVGAFNNDAGYITMDSVPAIPTNVSSFVNDAHYLTGYTETDPQFNAWDKDYNDLTNKPELFDGNYNSLTNKPELFDGNYNSLTNKPNLATVATTGNYTDLTNKPNLATVATTGNYTDLTNKPTIPAEANNAMLTIQQNGSTVGTFTADASMNKTINISVPTTTSELTNNSGFITADDIPAIPNNVSAFDNDAGYITQSQLSTANYITNTGNTCNNSIDLCNLLSTIENLQNQVQELSGVINEYNYGTVSNDTCPRHRVVIDGNPNVCYFGSHDINIILTAWVDGMADPDATYTWYESGQIRDNIEGWDNNYAEKMMPTYNNPYIYTVEVTKSDGCSYFSAPFKVNVYNRPFATITGSASQVCAGEAVILRANLQNNNDPMITFRWFENQATNSHALPGRTHEVEVVEPSSTTDYIVLVSHLMDANTEYCVAYDTFRVVVASCNGNGGSTSQTLPTVTTGNVTDITASSATCGGNVTSDGGANVTTRGLCWSTSPTPTIYDNNSTVGNGTGSFTGIMTGLTASTTYYVRAYAINSVGTVYGEEVSFTTSAVFTCGTSTVADVNNNKYNTVQIGNQCWMRENLRVTKYADGTNIALGSEVSTTTAYRYYPNNSSGNVSTYGYLYNWKAVMRASSSSSSNPSGVQGICPTGWHVPSDAEWTQLTDYVSNHGQYVCGSTDIYIAKALAATTGWTTSTSNNTCDVGYSQTTNNKTGFKALPAGSYYGNYFGFGEHTIFWSSTQYASSNAYFRSLYNTLSYVTRNYDAKSRAASVRCLRD